MDNTNKMKILMDTIVLKENIDISKEVVIRKWLNISKITNGSDELEFRRENINDRNFDTSFQNIMTKISAVIIVLFLIYLAFNLPSLDSYTASSGYESDKMLGAVLMFTSIISGILVNFLLLALYIFLIIIVLYFAFIRSKNEHLKKLRNQSFESPDSVRILNKKKEIIRIVSNKYISDIDFVLSSIDFERTIDNFRNLPNDSNLVIALASIDDQDIALCYG